MGNVIAHTYEVLHEIGSGGGGVVYLARHLRLDKLVVLKADRRTLSVKPESLRREVDVLKNLSHSYIPQVYDFFSEDGVVYTVMDYIEGESLDKPLKRGERFSQAQIIEWSCEVLEALVYLHSRPPYGILHADIKPSNIMLTPQGDIRLIDFNIALALKEEGAVKVGHSIGYASPEHYGDVYESPHLTETLDNKTVVDSDNIETVVDNIGSSYESGKRVMLDVRSDIYSLGATIYHLISGRRPARNVSDIIPLGRNEASPQVIAIVEKAMNPKPELRFQSAAEMLNALEHLHENDVRSKRHKKGTIIAAALAAAIFICGGATTMAGMKQIEREQNAYLLVEESKQYFEKGDVKKAVESASQALNILPEGKSARAERALSTALGVYDFTEGFKEYSAIDLGSEALKAALSPSGKTVAAMTQGMIHIFNVESGDKLASLECDASATADMLFGDDETLYYAGADALTSYDISKQSVNWKGGKASFIAGSEDGSKLAAVYRDEQFASIYDAKDGRVLSKVDFSGRHLPLAANDILADPEDEIFTLSPDGHWLAVSFSDGSLEIFDLTKSEDNAVIYEASKYTHFEGAFSGSRFAFVSTAPNDSVFAVIDMESMSQMGAFADTVPFHTFVYGSNIYVSIRNTLILLDPESGEQKEVAYTGSDIIDFCEGDKYNLVLTDSGKYEVYDKHANLVQTQKNGSRCDRIAQNGEYAILLNHDEQSIRTLRAESHEESLFCTYDPDIKHDEARVNSDGESVLLFRFDSFSICTIDGKYRKDVAIENPSEVYDQQYRREGGMDYLEVLYNDGLRIRYSAKDGGIIDSVKGDAPDRTLYEEFITDKFRISSPLHGTPKVYDLESGELIAELEADAYLTYVTQTDKGVITEYISMDGSRYGLLLNDNLEVIADLPELCDVFPDGTLFFDDMRGSIRKGRILNMDELREIGSMP